MGALQLILRAELRRRWRPMLMAGTRCSLDSRSWAAWY